MPLTLTLGLALAAAGCSTGPAPAETRHRGIPRQEVEAMLAAQAVCWNRGDLAGFVDHYTAEAPLTFLSGRGITRGREDLLAKYQAAYPDAAARGILRFGLAHLQPLGPDHALVLGTYRLERSTAEGGKPDGGWFTLVLRREADGAVRITHDHTSLAVDGLPPLEHP